MGWFWNFIEDLFGDAGIGYINARYDYWVKTKIWLSKDEYIEYVEKTHDGISYAIGLDSPVINEDGIIIEDVVPDMEITGVGRLRQKLNDGELLKDVNKVLGEYWYILAIFGFLILRR